MDSNLRALLYGNPATSPSSWTNGRVTVRYRASDDVWTWSTNDGKKGSSDMAETVLKAIAPYLRKNP